jgi:hypothetical protein
MEEDFFTRLDKFMKFKGLNDNQLTVQTGISVGSLGKQRKKGRSLSTQSVAKILNTYCELDALWLLTGRETMLLSGTSSERTFTATELKEKIKDLEQQIKDLHIELKNTNREMGKKEGEVELLKALILEKNPELYQSLFSLNIKAEKMQG